MSNFILLTQKKKKPSNSIQLMSWVLRLDYGSNIHIVTQICKFKINFEYIQFLLSTFVRRIYHSSKIQRPNMKQTFFMKISLMRLWVATSCHSSVCWKMSLKVVKVFTISVLMISIEATEFVLPTVCPPPKLYILK